MKQNDLFVTWKTGDRIKSLCQGGHYIYGTIEGEQIKWDDGAWSELEQFEKEIEKA